MVGELEDEDRNVVVASVVVCKVVLIIFQNFIYCLIYIYTVVKLTGSIPNFTELLVTIARSVTEPCPNENHRSCISTE